MVKGKIRCPECECELTKKDLLVRAETEGDEGGLYVVHVYVCPKCGVQINDKRLKPLGSYKAPSNDEPLRWEM